MRYVLLVLMLTLTVTSHSVVSQTTTPSLTFYSECTPSTDVTSLSGEYDRAVEQRLEEIFEADQADREIMMATTETFLSPDVAMKIALNDLNRRQEVYGYIANGQVASGEAFYYAALIFHHGDCPEHYEFANRLAAKGIEMGFEEAKQMYALSLDRYLQSTGKKQKFGTQGGTENCDYYDLETTDEERAAYNLPTLQELKEREGVAPAYCDDR